MIISTNINHYNIDHYNMVLNKAVGFFSYNDDNTFKSFNKVPKTLY